MDRGAVRNLWARHGQSAPIVCLAGHVDVVPPGPADRWTSDPFVPAERDGLLFGRGAADMKTSVAAMVTAAERFVARASSDRGNEYFSPTSFQIAHVQAGTGARNVIPGTLDVLFNFRFSTESTADDLQRRVTAVLDAHGVEYDLSWQLTGNPFLSPRGGLVDVVSAAVTLSPG